MPLYFGHLVPKLSKGKKPEVAPELVAKGIELLRSPPSDIHITAVPIAHTSFWALFQSYFSAILYCLSTGNVTSLCPTNQEIEKSHPTPLPLALPPLCVSLVTQSASAVEFLHKLGFEQTEIRGSTYFLTSNTTRELVKKLVASDCPVRINERCFAPFRFCNMASLYSALDLLTLFSYVSQAMGFSTCLDTSKDSDDYDVLEAPAIVSMAKDKQASMDVDTTSNDNKTLKHPIAELFDGGAELVSTFLNKMPVGSVTIDSISSRASYLSTEDVLVDCTGNVFRYVAELAMEDSRTVISFIERYCFLNLGVNSSDCATSLEELRSSWGNLKQTDFGLELTHIVKCFDLGMNAHVSVTPIFDNGYYEATVVAGVGHYFVLNKEIVRPQSPVTLVNEMKALATHSNALETIQSIVARIMGKPIDLSTASTMVQLREMLLKYPLTEQAKEEIVSLAYTLRFPSRPWNVNYGSLRHLLEIVKDPSIITDYTPIGPRGIFSKDALVLGLSCFGEGTCPSFLHPNGTKIDLAGNLPRPSGESSTNMRGPKGKQSVSNAAWTLAVRRVRFDEALGDFRKMLQESMARSISSSTARGMGCVVFSGKQFADLFLKLGEVAKVLSGSSSLNRSRETDDTGLKDNDDLIKLDGRRAKKVKF